MAALTVEQRETLRLRNPKMAEVADSSASKLAAELGEAGNVEALKEIARLGDYRLLDDYVYPFGRSRGELPAEVEALLVKLLRDPKLWRSALPLIGRWPECRHTYASRELFDTLREIQESPPNSAATSELAIHFVCTTRRDFDVAMAQTIAKSKARDRSLIVNYLIKKRAVNTIPALETALTSIPSQKDDYIHGQIDLAFLEFDTPESIEAFYHRVAWIGRNPTAPGVEQEVRSVASKLEYWPPTTPLSYRRLRPLLVAVPVSQHTLSMINATKRIKDPAAARDLLAFVDGPYGANAIEAILEVGAPADWRTLDEKLAALPSQHALNDAKYKALRDRLKTNVTAPDVAVAQRDSMNRMQAWRTARSGIEQRAKPQETLRRGDPARYAAETQSYLASAEKLLEVDASEPEVRSYRGTVAGEYQRLATFTRFTLKEPARAVRLYEHSIAIGAPLRREFYLGTMERMGLADTLRFDLRDDTRALVVYRELLARLKQEPRPTGDGEAAIGSLLVEWLDAEIAFLAEGKRYTGQPSLESVSGVGMMLYFTDGGTGFASDDAEMAALLGAARAKGGMSGEQKREAAVKLEAFTPSQARFVWAFQILPQLGSPERIAAFARRHDPSGFATANAYATLHAIEALKANPKMLQGEALFGWSKADEEAMAAAEKAALGRTVAVAMQPDPRLASPEETWKTFVAALRMSDFETMWKCTAPGIRNKFEASFRAMTPEQRREAADSMNVFARATEYGSFVEAFVGKKGGHGGIVTFGRRGKDWIIREM